MRAGLQAVIARPHAIRAGEARAGRRGSKHERAPLSSEVATPWASEVRSSRNSPSAGVRQPRWNAEWTIRWRDGRGSSGEYGYEGRQEAFALDSSDGTCAAATAHSRRMIRFARDMPAFSALSSAADTTMKSCG